MEHAGSEIEIGTRVIGDVHGRPLLVDAVEFADGFPVLVHHGSPGSRRLFRRDADVAAADFGLRLISFDRPGYAGRGRRRGRQVADVVEDVRAIAEAFDIDRMATWGFSGGGPFALACASQLPE